MNNELLLKNILDILPLWNNKIVKPFKQSLQGELSLELYYCMQVLKKFEPLTMTETAQHLNMTKQTATKVVDKLYSIHFIERIADENDRRIIQIRTTDIGKNYIDKNYCKDSIFLEAIMESLNEEEMVKMNQAIETLKSLLPKI